ncbi:MAG: MFS transporter [Planctomycetota bacterium]|nr:MFS transporter [Planctomycetota bacterium]
MTDTPPPLDPKLNARLSVMMFLQYGIWGAWLPLFFPFLTEHRGFTPAQAGNLFAIAAIGALVAPFIAGQIADRWFNTEKFLGVSHLLGAFLVWQLATVTAYEDFVLYGLLYSLLYAPTLPLTNSLAFHHLPDRDRDFSRVRVWGTVGWIAVGIGVGQWLLHTHTPAEGSEAAIRTAQVTGMADAFKVSALLGVIMGVYCFLLPKTPPQPGKEKFAPFEALREIVRDWRHNPLFWLFLIAFPVSCIHQFYFVHTAGYLGTLETDAGDTINKIFGVGGGGLMTIGQMAEILVLAVMPWIAKGLSRKALLTTGVAAYVARFGIFALFPEAWAVIPALALHGLCFGCFFFVAFLIVDEETTHDVRASAQGLFNLIVVGLGVIVGNWFAGQVAQAAQHTEVVDGVETTVMDYEALFGIPALVAVGCFVLLMVLYPKKRAPAP